MEFNRPWDKSDDLKIKKFENSLGYPLPKDYREFLFNQNGGRPKDRLIYSFQMMGRGFESVVKTFYGIDAEGWGDIALVIENFHRHQKRMPRYLLPIATDPFGNKICIILDKSRYGEVVHWEMGEDEPEYDEDTKKWTKDPLCNSFTIAESFTDFLNSLKTEESGG